MSSNTLLISPRYWDRRAQGFTLLEIMVVMLLIAISVTYVTIRLNRDADSIAELEAQRFIKLIEQARDESVLTGRPLAIDVNISERNYTFLYRNKEKWDQIKNDDVFKVRSFPEDVDIQFNIQSISNAGSEQNNALLIIEEVGEVTPFQLSITGDSKSYKVILDEDQKLNLESDEKQAG